MTPQSDPPSEAAAFQLDAIRMVRDVAQAIERRIQENLSGAGADAGTCRSDTAIIQCLQEQMVHLSRVATLGTLAASIAHEIRQPLTAIRIEAGTIERWMKRDAPMAGEVSEGIRRIQEQSERAERVIRSLRALMRREPLPPQPFRLDDALREVLPLADCRISVACVDLRLELDTTLPPVHGDRVQIQQVMLNLLLNAVEARRDGSPGTARVTLRTRHGAAGMAVVEVIDNGRGIEPEQLARIFEPFFSTKDDGMGIGLAICRSIVELHGGTIAAASGDGQTTVTVALPLYATA
ncbi:Two-component system sensor histidine kinase [Cupriavidus sp. U2]|uniref:sensor histidine kinase n=1 Tax=Cupriavidus sp. U2 TaxID=2920269 RepID=UPI00129E5089|nr:ATP-binding protein [Cupriavidus sp. U2]KAI3590914.1 Two-component system sensor histidine kinase [Cupriavidus sp. U2]